jgi:hypothetical protein
VAVHKVIVATYRLIYQGQVVGVGLKQRMRMQLLAQSVSGTALQLVCCLTGLQNIYRLLLLNIYSLWQAGVL